MDSCTAYTFSSETHLWHRHLQSHPPFSLLWSQRRQIPLTSSFLVLPLFCCLLSYLTFFALCFLCPPHLFFLSVISSFFQSRKGRRCGSVSSWGPGTPSVQGARVASSPISLPGLGPFLAPAFSFPGRGPDRLRSLRPIWNTPLGPRNIYLDLLPKIDLVAFLILNHMSCLYIL